MAELYGTFKIRIQPCPADGGRLRTCLRTNSEDTILFCDVLPNGREAFPKIWAWYGLGPDAEFGACVAFVLNLVSALQPYDKYLAHTRKW